MPHDPRSIPLLPERLLDHASFVQRLSRSILGATDGDDAAQDAWLNALSHHPRTPGSERAFFTTALRRIASNLRRSTARRRARERRQFDETKGIDVPDPREIAAREEARSLVVSSVLRLEEPYRTVVLLHYYEGLDVGAIARRLAVTTNTITSRLHRARERLRDDLEARYGHSRDSWRAALLPLSRWKPRTASHSASVVGVKGASGLGILGGLAFMSTTSKAITALVAASVVVTGLLFLRNGESAKDREPIPVDAQRGTSAPRLVADAPGTEAPVVKSLDVERTKAPAPQDPANRPPPRGIHGTILVGNLGEPHERAGDGVMWIDSRGVQSDTVLVNGQPVPRPDPSTTLFMEIPIVAGTFTTDLTNPDDISIAGFRFADKVAFFDDNARFDRPKYDSDLGVTLDANYAYPVTVDVVDEQGARIDHEFALHTTDWFQDREVIAGQGVGTAIALPDPRWSPVAAVDYYLTAPGFSRRSLTIDHRRADRISVSLTRAGAIRVELSRESKDPRSRVLLYTQDGKSSREEPGPSFHLDHSFSDLAAGEYRVQFDLKQDIVGWKTLAAAQVRVTAGETTTVKLELPELRATPPRTLVQYRLRVPRELAGESLRLSISANEVNEWPNSLGRELIDPVDWKAEPDSEWRTIEGGAFLPGKFHASLVVVGHGQYFGQPFEVVTGGKQIVKIDPPPPANVCVRFIDDNTGATIDPQVVDFQIEDDRQGGLPTIPIDRRISRTDGNCFLVASGDLVANAFYLGRRAMIRTRVVPGGNTIDAHFPKVFHLRLRFQTNGVAFATPSDFHQQLRPAKSENDWLIGSATYDPKDPGVADLYLIEEGVYTLAFPHLAGFVDIAPMTIESHLGGQEERVVALIAK